MGGDDVARAGGSYLGGLPVELQDQLASVNAIGLDRLAGYLGSGQAVAFLGAGASAPLYPLWTPLIGELVDIAVSRGLAAEAAATVLRLSS
ncbi:MAG: hypothetical protein L0Y54_02535 [Sporichthyaceae bacterium]|nr:hypothetical protein [Sporichthyaceae bacterium]